MKSFFLNIVFATFALFASAQQRLTLKQAVEIGIKNNIDVLQSDLLMQKAGINLKQSKEYRLPDLNASLNHGKNFGRSIDPFTNGYIDQKVGYANYSASSNLLLFNGFALQNQIKANKLGYEASKEELQQAKDNLTINIILAYLQVLSAEEVLKQSQDQVTVTQKQVERLDILNKSGAILPADFFDMKGQLATDQVAISDNKANLETAKLNLVQLLNIPYHKDLELEKIPAENFNPDYSGTPDEIYKTALQQFAQVQAVKLRTQSAEKNIRSIKGQLFPTLSLGGSVNTNYSSVATREYFVNSTENPSSNYVTVSGTQYPVIVKQDIYTSKKISFGNQLSNNLFEAVNVGLTIPLFNNGRIRNQVKMAKLELKNSQYLEQNTKTQLQQSIERAYVNLTSAADKYKLLQDQVSAFAESFRTAEIRFNAGAITSVDYLIAKNNLNRAQYNLITAKYDFVLREKVLDYYGGKPLW
ncbi:MAG: TolC family protein [Bacteroidota bacterium]|nr:TolC family protein [Bacteroidota bacterium]